MGKRSDFKRIDKDLYQTIQRKAVYPLLDHIPPAVRYIEPCAGAGALIDHLAAYGHVCRAAYDIDPLRDDIRQADATRLAVPDDTAAEMIITNPPWSRDLLHPIIHNFAAQLPTWLLFDSDWSHTKQAWPFLPFCRKIVSVGRLKFIPGSDHDGKDNCSWYLFDKQAARQFPIAAPEFHPRQVFNQPEFDL